MPQIHWSAKKIRASSVLGYIFLQVDYGLVPFPTRCAQGFELQVDYELVPFPTRCAQGFELQVDYGLVSFPTRCAKGFELRVDYGLVPFPTRCAQGFKLRVDYGLVPFPTRCAQGFEQVSWGLLEGKFLAPQEAMRCFRRLPGGSRCSFWRNIFENFFGAIYIYMRPAMKARRATLESMGLRSEKAVAKHILEENVWESNLVPDIAGVDYLEGHQGQTNHGPLAASEVVRVRGRRPTCTTGEEGSARRVVSKLSIAAWEVWNRNLHVSIVHTVANGGAAGRILSTIRAIEARQGGRARWQWQRIFPGEEPEAYFVAKFDVSELPMQELQEGLAAMRRRLEVHGFGLYQIDYTRDFAGTLDREALVRHLENAHGFSHQGDFAFPEEGGRILDNTGSVGAHVCTVLQTRNGRTTSKKFYSKDISQIEAGEIRETFGEHLAHLVDSPNQHQRRTLAHPAVRARGCTRIEISLHACDEGDLSANTAERLLEEALALATPCEDEACAAEGHEACGERGLFVVQPISKKWENHARHLDRCLLLGDRTHGSIYPARSGHSKTGRVQGMLVRPSPAVVANDEQWEWAMQWTVADFGLRNCPIFRTEILGMEGEEVLFSPLQAYTKDAPTILAAHNKPCELHLGAPDPGEVLPPTEHVGWVWRRQKTHPIGIERPSCELLEVPEIAAGRRLSTLSTRGLLRRQEELLEAAAFLDWEARIRLVAERHIAWGEELAAEREREKALLEATVQRRREEIAGTSRARSAVEEALLGNTQKVADIAGKAFDILGARTTERGGRRVVLRASGPGPGPAPAPDNDQPAICVWATRGLERILDNQEGSCFSRTRGAGCGYRCKARSLSGATKGRKFVGTPLLFWRPQGRATCSRFRKSCKTCTSQKRALAAAKRRRIGPKKPLACQAPPAKSCKKALEMDERDYFVPRFAETEFRGAPRTVFFLCPIGEDGLPTTDEETPVFGVFLQEEARRIWPLSELGGALYCRLGREKTTRTNKKCRLAWLFVREPQEPTQQEPTQQGPTQQELTQQEPTYEEPPEPAEAPP